MITFHRTLILFFSISLMAGCAGQSAIYNLDYSLPEETVINNEVVVLSDYDKTWSDLVGEMSKSFYVINNIDKESRLINLSFSINTNISDYVDCGNSIKQFSYFGFWNIVIYLWSGTNVVLFNYTFLIKERVTNWNP